MKVARKPNETVNRRRAGEFMETLLRLFFLAFVVAAVVSPPEPLVFVALLVPGWILSVPLAYLLVYGGRREWLAGSNLYDPGPLSDRRPSLWFAATAILLKLVALGVLAVLTITPGRIGGVVLGLLALALASLLVYRGGYERAGLVR